jgi:hypothetical protein
MRGGEIRAGGFGKGKKSKHEPIKVFKYWKDLIFYDFFLLTPVNV